ncbi:hypothetical protein DFH09DRAFT_1367543, partial [Mycena vulgaris]
MSILVNGTSVTSMSYSPLLARTTLSFALAASMPPPPNFAFLITTVTRRFDSYSASIICDLALDPPTHIVLGRDWGAFLRDTLLSFGLRLDHSFDVWIFLSNPDNPISILNPDSSHRGANDSDKRRFPVPRPPIQIHAPIVPTPYLLIMARLMLLIL